MLGLRHYGMRPASSLPLRRTLGGLQLRQLKNSAVFPRKHEPQEKDEKHVVDNVEKQQRTRPQARQTSLRRVGLEAERSRAIVQDRGGLRIIDPELETKKVTAYCAAEQYNIATAARLVKADGFELDPYNTGLYPQVVHIQTPILPPGLQKQVYTEREHGDLFIFPSGTVVAWNVPERIALRLVERVLPPAALNSHSGSLEMEKEDLEYIEDNTKERSAIVGDTIILGAKQESQYRQNRSDSSSLLSAEATLGAESPEKGTALAKIAFSSGLARSTKLAVLERLTESYFESTRSIPTIMSRGTPLPFMRPRLLRRLCEVLGLGARLPFSRPFILRKTGELLSIRAQLNLYSELTDSLPDLFWDSKHELGLEGYYDHVGRALDVGVRIRVLNDKLDYAQEIASVLRETLSERHSSRLEWLIIFLITVEVIFELMRLGGEYVERKDPENVERLLKRYIKADIEEKELGRK